MSRWPCEKCFSNSLLFHTSVGQAMNVSENLNQAIQSLTSRYSVVEHIHHWLDSRWPDGVKPKHRVAAEHWQTWRTSLSMLVAYSGVLLSLRQGRVLSDTNSSTLTTPSSYELTAEGDHKLCGTSPLYGSKSLWKCRIPSECILQLLLFLFPIIPPPLLLPGLVYSFVYRFGVCFALSMSCRSSLFLL